jgi:hypothetical protein
MHVEVNDGNCLKYCRLFWFQGMWWLQNDTWPNGINCNWVPQVSNLLLISMCPYFFLVPCNVGKCCNVSQSFRLVCIGWVKWNACSKMVWNIWSVPGWSRFTWYQLSVWEWRLVGIAIFPLKYTNSAHWMILVSKSWSLFVMHCCILLLAKCALEMTSKAIELEMHWVVHWVQRFLQEMLIRHVVH